MSETFTDLLIRSKGVLEKNWLGHATRPAPDLYPHQWSWDSAFIAMGYSHYNPDRAEIELRSLFKGQWSNGLLPHIVFNPAAKDYSPGPDFWRTDLATHAPRKPLTSGTIQPPVHATAVMHIYEHFEDRERAHAFLREMFPKLKAWHHYLFAERAPDGDGLLYIRHPWESGQDNSPIWDNALKRISLKAGDVPEYRRVDTEIVDSADRPSNEEYDRYAYLVKVAYDNGYEEARIREACPFLIKDVLLNAIWVKANHDMVEIARVLGEDWKPFLEWADLTEHHLNSDLWVDKTSIYLDYDMTTGSLIDSHVAAGFTPLFAGVPSRNRAVKICERLNTHSFCRLDHVCLSVPSYDKKKPGFSGHQYWRGPIWINMNWLLYHGLKGYGLYDYAARVKKSMLKLAGDCGLFEYYDPDSGRGHGAENFSWSAALVLDLIYEEELTPL
jgi:glycogen debranching enzyme